MMEVEKIVSGGQTGVDRAALDVALQRGLPCGGWCPLGRRAEDGPLDRRYPLVETDSAYYGQRTALNVRDADGTLILNRGIRLQGGTALTRRLALERRKPCLVVDLTGQADFAAVRMWLRRHQVRVLNVAGPRESDNQGIYRQAQGYLNHLLDWPAGHGEEGVPLSPVMSLPPRSP